MRAPGQTSPLLLAVLAIFMGSGVDAVVKGLAAGDSVVSIMGWRFFFGGLFTFALFKALRRPTPSRRALAFHGLRGVIQVTAAVLFFWSLTQLALAEATTLGFTAALMIAPFAWLILGERISAVSAAAAAIGFAGAAVAVSTRASGAPVDGDRLLGAIACLVSAVCYALILVLMRQRSRTEDALTIITGMNVACGLILFPVTLAAFPIPPVERIAAYAGLSVLGVAVWWVMTLAYARAPAQRLAPLEYTALLWSAAFGFIFFSEAPGWRLYAGAALIIAACLVVAFEGRFASRRAARAPLGHPPP